MEIAITITLVVLNVALIFLVRYTAYEGGRERGEAEAIKKLTMDGDAVYFALPYDMINEESADRMRRYLLAAKEEHAARMTNKKEELYSETCNSDKTSKERHHK